VDTRKGKQVMSKRKTLTYDVSLRNRSNRLKCESNWRTNVDTCNVSYTRLL